MRKVLVANRGEVAVRVIRACRDLGIASVAVYSECDRAARHVRMADEAVGIGADPPAESYLRIDRIVEAARAAGADAVHPGYGFLAERAAFAEACRDAGLLFIGPPPDAIARMGSKTAARQAAMAAGIPVVPGTADPIPADAPGAEIARIAGEVGYPVVVKAVAGGGGKGMRLVTDPGDLAPAVRAARSEALAAFGDAAIYLERHLGAVRHVEVQILADEHGTVMPFVERECSVQRRHQKVVEESPSPGVSPALRADLASAAAALAAGAGYRNAGTVEFLLDAAGRWYFLEMNTRLQVEHPVTELVTGVDLVCWQIRIARGEPLALDPASLLAPRGHAVECRILAEDPDAGFLPAPGRITAIRAPAGPGIRVDSGVDPGADVPRFYDPLVAKLVGWGADRAEAIARLRRALDEYEIMGVRTTVPFARWLLRQPPFLAGTFHTGLLDEVLQSGPNGRFSAVDPAVDDAAAVALAVRAAMGTAPETGGSDRPAVPHRARRPWAVSARIGALRA